MNSEVGKAIQKAKERTLKEVEQTIGTSILLGVAIATINNFEKNLKEELKNE